MFPKSFGRGVSLSRLCFGILNLSVHDNVLSNGTLTAV